MNILWFTGRKFDNFCSTTQSSLAMGLINRGHTIHFLNPDEQGDHEEYPWQHTGFSLSSIVGLQSRTLAKKMNKWLKTNHIENGTIAIVDWRLIKILYSELEKKKIPWILMDRSPPADTGLLAFLQWPVWKNAWKIVSKCKSAKGCIVSKGHQKLIQSKVSISPDKFTIIPAGVDLEVFYSSKKDEIFTMVYHGRLDKHRGVLSLPMFAHKAIQSGIKLKLILIGEGDVFNQLQNISKSYDYIRVEQIMEQKLVAEILAKSHLGLLPMPETKLWSIASPLKRSEYAAAGMMIFGIDHLGHQFPNLQNNQWMKLVPQHDFHQDGINWIKTLDLELIEKYSKEARAFAEKELSWKNSILSLEQMITDQSNILS